MARGVGHWAQFGIYLIFRIGQVKVPGITQLGICALFHIIPTLLSLGNLFPKVKNFDLVLGHFGLKSIISQAGPLWQGFSIYLVKRHS